MKTSQRRIAVKGSSAATVCATAAALAAAGKVDEAIAGYRHALTISPGFARAHTELAHLLCKQRRIEEAISHLRRAIDFAPDLAEPHNALGNILKRNGMIAGAAQLYAQAVEIDPTHAEARNNLGLALVALRRTAEAISHFREALKVDPNFIDARLNLAAALIDIDARSDALEELEIARDDSDSAGFPLPRLGMLFSRCGARERASACFSAHAAQCPGDREAMQSLLAWIGTAAARDECLNALAAAG